MGAGGPGAGPAGKAGRTGHAKPRMHGEDVSFRMHPWGLLWR